PRAVEPASQAPGARSETLPRATPEPARAGLKEAPVTRFVATALILVVLASIPTAALASGPTVVGLRTPPPPAGLVNVHWGYCAASGFNADSTIAGVCQYSYGSAQRFHSSPTNSYWMTWGIAGQIIGLGAQCGHTTGTRTGNWSDPGCVRNYQGTGTVVTINGVPYYYVATDPVTGNELVSSNSASYLVVQTAPPAPQAPTVTASLVPTDMVKVSWTPDPATQSQITSSVVTVAPAAGFSAPTLTTTVTGTGTSATLGPLQPATTYDVSVVNVDSGGSSPPGTTTIAVPASTQAPAAPTISNLFWNGGHLIVDGTAPAPGDSPIDSYEVSVVFVDGDVSSGPYDATVSGSTLRAYFTVDTGSDWGVKVRAHNAAGWGPWSAQKVLPGL